MKKFSLAVADPLYFMHFGPALVMSALETDNNLYLAVIDWGKNNSHVHTVCARMREVAAHYPNVDFQVWQHCLPYRQVDDEHKRIFYACARYHVIDQLLQTMLDVQIHSMDIDSIFMRPLDIPDDVKLGLYLREEENLGTTEQEKRGMKVLGHTILSSHCADYVRRVSKYIADRNWAYWFLDQEALYYSLTDVEREFLWDMKDKDLIDWEFTPHGKIWSGKGPRKFNARPYVELFHEKTRQFFSKVGDPSIAVAPSVLI